MLNRPGPRPVPGVVVAVRGAVRSQTATPAADAQHAVTTTTTTDTTPGSVTSTTTTATITTTTTATTTTPGGTTTTTMAVITPTLSAQAQGVQQSNQDGLERLRKAIVAGVLDDVKQLLADPMGEFLLNALLDGATTALALAVVEHKEDIVEFLIGQKNTEINKARADGLTPLHCAVGAGRVDFVHLLLDGNADVNACANNVTCMTPLHFAVKLNRDKSVAALIARNANVHALDSGGATPFYVAVENSHVGIAQRLRDAGADINQPKGGGWHPVHQACFHGTTEMVDWLWKAGADFDAILAFQGWTWMHVAAKNTHHPDIIEMVQDRMDPVKFQKTADTADRWGTKPVGMAAEWGQSDAVIGLLQLTRVAPPMAFKPADHNRCWIILGSSLPYRTFDTVIESGRKAGVEMKKHGDGVQDLTWESLEALDVRPGDSVALSCHGQWLAETRRATLMLGKNETAPLTDVVRLLYLKGARNILLLGCEIVNAMTPLMNRFRHDPGIPQPLPGHDAGLAITVVGDGGLTSAPTNIQTMALWVEDRAMQRITAKAGNAMQRLSVQAMQTLAWDGSTWQLARREVLDPEQLSGLTATEAAQAKVNLMFMHAGLGDLKGVQTMIEQHGVDPNVQGVEGHTALAMATVGQYLPLVDYLVKRPGLEIDLEDHSGRTPLWMACRSNNFNIAALLLAAGASVDTAESVFGHTPLRSACQNGCHEVVVLLLHTGANWNVTDKAGTLPLHVACSEGHIGIVKLLLKAGADPKAKAKANSAYGDASGWAATYGHADIVALLDQVDKAKTPDEKLKLLS
jgi:ankyrin repeat protein